MSTKSVKDICPHNYHNKNDKINNYKFMIILKRSSHDIMLYIILELIRAHF